MVSRHFDERSLIAGTIRDIEGSIDRLEADRQELDTELDDKRRRLQVWRSRLAEIDRRSDGGDKGARRRKGENRQIIVTLLEAHPERGMTMAKVASATGLPWSSVRATFKRNTETFIERDGIWYLQERHAANGRAEDSTTQK